MIYPTLLVLTENSYNFRTSSNLPGRIAKHGSFTKQSHVSSPKNHVKYGREKREKTDKNLFGNHSRHRKVSKTRSHTTHRSSHLEDWNEFNQLNLNTNYLPNHLKQSSQTEFHNSNKWCSHEPKSDFNEKMCEHNVPERQVGALPGINVPKMSSKQPLKKSNTFPYEKLHSDTTSYSSSENESIGCEKNKKEDIYENPTDENIFLDYSNQSRKR